ncbi:MAG TPA: A/G-specific adenine glycosylase [Acidimicrobiales bacterium]|nr:A/G-specific adenine glycosylase [Acidimicrobiales bacterium]
MATTSGSSDVAAFRRALRRGAESIARPLPWVGHVDPWAILVSEVMLQQTKTSRVIDPWHRFLEAFPTPAACARAPLARVLQLWSGLGYHRRAKALHECARAVCERHDGRVPSTVAELRALPGVGEYTAHAVASFAFAAPVAVLDTNVGRVLARAITNRTLSVREARIVAGELLPRHDVARFNQSMLDLGAQFCKAVARCEGCPVARVCRWHGEGGVDPAPRSAGVSRPQSAFEGSDRQLRGRILAQLRAHAVTRAELDAITGEVDRVRGERVLRSLLVDGLVEDTGALVQLASH